MTKTKLHVPPQSWMDLKPAELHALLMRHPPFVRPADLLFAQWVVAQHRASDERDAEQQAWDAERAAFDAWMAKRNGKTLTAYELALSRHKSAAAACQRAEARSTEIYNLLSEAGA